MSIVSFSHVNDSKNVNNLNENIGFTHLANKRLFIQLHKYHVFDFISKQLEHYLQSELYIIRVIAFIARSTCAYFIFRGSETPYTDRKQLI